MTNVPLDSLNKRYPNIYPDQLNQLNNQMGNLNVTQSSYNKLWVFIFIFFIKIFYCLLRIWNVAYKCVTLTYY